MFCIAPPFCLKSHQKIQNFCKIAHYLCTRKTTKNDRNDNEKTYFLHGGSAADGGFIPNTVRSSDFTHLMTLHSLYATLDMAAGRVAIESGVLLTTKENLQSAQNAGIELIWSLPAARWLDLNANGYYSQIDASRLGFGKNKDTFSWSALLNTNFHPLSRYMIQLNVRYRSATLVPQGRRDLRINLGMKYDIPAINLSVIASVTDLFDTYRKSYTLDTPELKQKVEKRRNPHIFYIGVAWQFGGSKGKKHNTNMEYDEGL